MSASPLRGAIYLVDMGEGIGDKFVVVISNNRRNHRLPTAIGLRITSTTKNQGLETMVPLSAEDSLDGFVVCDDPITLREQYDDFKRQRGALTKATMAKVERGVAIALGLPVPPLDEGTPPH